MDYALGTWNVKTLNKPGAMKLVLEQIDKHNVKIAAIQETRWLGKGIMDYNRWQETCVCVRRETKK
jgi:hypothetical protein